MIQEEKDLLLKDLCARLPYGVKCTTKSLWNGIYIIEGYKNNRVFLDCPVYDEGDDEWMIESIVPYLRPMSSMTETERVEYDNMYYKDEEGASICNNDDWFDFMNSHHFDYRGLIEKNLALEAPERMYDIKKK